MEPDHYLALLSELVALDTASPLDGRRLLAVERFLSRFGFRRLGRSLFARGDESSPIWAYSHADTKPAGPRSAWRSDPLSLEARDGRWHGLGISDSKFQLLNLLASPRAARGFTLCDVGEECGDPEASEFLGRHRVGTLVVVDGASDSFGAYNGLMGQVDGAISIRTGESPRHPARVGESEFLRLWRKLLSDLEGADFRFNVTGLTCPTTERSLTVEEASIRFDLRFSSTMRPQVDRFLQRWMPEVRQWYLPLQGCEEFRAGPDYSPLPAPFSCTLGRPALRIKRVIAVPGAIAENGNHRPDEFIFPWQVAKHQATLDAVLGDLEGLTDG